MSLQNVLLWYVDYFELTTIKAQKTQEELSTFPLTAEKSLDRGNGSEKELSPERTTKRLG